ncbi:MAG: F0F1 ATP synthase subunit epsilon [Bacteroidales bacterium]|nr:F0F1 ATP synthase subunit epsilon [Bacteroidales bacterium]
MKIEILTPEESVYEGDIKSLKVPGKKGAFQVLKDHAAIVSTLVEGKVSVTDMKGGVSDFLIEGGVMEVHQNTLVLLAESVKSE